MHLTLRDWRPLVILSLSGILLSCGDGPTEPPDPVATKLGFATSPPSATMSGEVLSPQPVIQLQDAAGAAVAKPGVVVTATLDGGTVTGGTATTGSNGRATFSGLALSASPGSRTLHFNGPNIAGLTHAIELTAGATTVISANSVVTQSSTAGLPVPQPPSVKLTDETGNPAAGVVVTFAVLSGAGVVSEAVQQSGPDGVATVGAWILALAPGPQSVRATAAGVGGSVTFTATGVLLGEATAQPAEIQLAVAGSATAIAPSVMVTESGSAKVGAIVRFLVEQGDGAVSVSTTVTDASGVATAVEWRLGTALGKNTVRVEVPGYAPGPLHVQAWAVSALPATLVVQAGDGQIAEAGKVLPTAPAVSAQDAEGNPIAGFPVTFTLEGDDAGSITGAVTMTNVAGVAAVGSWTMPLTNGTVRLLAAAPPLMGSPVQFNATLAIVEIVSGTITAQVATTVDVLPRVRVTTPGGDVLAGVPVEFAVAAGGGALTGASTVTNASGLASPASWTLGTTAGQQGVSATVGAVSPAIITAIASPGPPAAAMVVRGDNQSGPVYNPLRVDPTIRILDQYGNATPGGRAVFTVIQGGGQRQQETQISNSAGEVSARWWLGGAIGSNQLSVSFPSDPITSMAFSATATPVSSAFDIEVMYVGTPTAAEQEAVEAAVARWRTIIQGDVPALPVALAAATCTDNQPAINQAADDLLVLVDFSYIDGPGKVLGSAGPCVLRATGRIPAFGTITIDGADATDLASSGELKDVMLHELGHVLGFGTIWSFKNLLVGAGGSDPQYTGAAATQAYHALGGSLPHVPVEGLPSGPGTADSHWRESVFSSELMTGYIGGTNNPLSKVTSRSLIDLGYVIDDATADPLGFTPSFRREAEAARAKVPLRQLSERPLTGPIILVYPDGTSRKVPR